MKSLRNLWKRILAGVRKGMIVMSRQAKMRKSNKPILVKISDIFIPKKDYPPAGELSADNPRFEELKTHIKKHGLLTPVFINPDKLLVGGHYRLWAWQALGEVFIKAFVVDDSSDKKLEEEIDDYFESAPVLLPVSSTQKKGA